MKITKKSLISGENNTREIDITEQELDRWNKGDLIQNAAPHLSAEDREFLISGITPEEWREAFGWMEEGMSNEWEEDIY